jgi:hypothetical protein
MENGRWRDLPLSDSQETLFLKKQTRKSEANNERKKKKKKQKTNVTNTSQYRTSPYIHLHPP